MIDRAKELWTCRRANLFGSQALPIVRGEPKTDECVASYTSETIKVKLIPPAPFGFDVRREATDTFNMGAREIHTKRNEGEARSSVYFVLLRVCSWFPLSLSMNFCLRRTPLYSSSNASPDAGASTRQSNSSTIKRVNGRHRNRSADAVFLPHRE